MIAIAEAPAFLLVIFLVALVAAAVVDLVKRQVPNTAVIAVALSGIAGFATTGNWELLWQPLLVAIGVLAVGVPLFERKWVGGGDIKLLAATACWFTAKGSLWFLASVFLTGGVLALSMLAVRFAQRPRRMESTGAPSGIPYAVAIAIGAMWQVWHYRL